jgi:hypothetical protein
LTEEFEMTAGPAGGHGERDDAAAAAVFDFQDDAGYGAALADGFGGADFVRRVRRGFRPGRIRPPEPRRRRRPDATTPRRRR